MRLASSVSLVVATAAVLVSPGLVAAHTKTFPTTFNPDPPNVQDLGWGEGKKFAYAEFSGKLSSPKARCIRDRKIAVVHIHGEQGLLGEVITDADGYWSLDTHNTPGNNRDLVQYGEKYRAFTHKVVLRRDSRHKHVCDETFSHSSIVLRQGP